MDASCRTPGNNARLMKIAVVAAKHVRVAALGGLQYIKVVGIAQRRMAGRPDRDDVRGLFQKLRVVVELVIRKGMEFLQPRIPENPDCFRNDHIREDQCVTPFE